MGETTVNVDKITGTGGLLEQLQKTIVDAVDGSWKYIGTIVGVALLLYLGKALLRAVRSYFGTAS